MFTHQLQQGGGIGLNAADVIMGLMTDFFSKTARGGAFNAQ
jgi:hypothetical protein